MTYKVALVDLAVALEVIANRAVRDVLHYEVLEYLSKHLEAGVVCGEDECAAVCQVLHAAADEISMVALYVKASSSLAVGECWRIAEDEVEHISVLSEECKAVVPVEEVVHRIEAVCLHVAHGPVKVVGVGIHTYR